MTQDAAHLFNQQQVDSKRIPDWKSREKMICMPIDDFLSMAKPGHQPEKLSRIEAAIERGNPLSDIPFLIAYAKDESDAVFVVGHEGRHRAKALKAMGLETMPVIIKGDIRWSEQADPQRFDYRENWPTTLVSETGESSIPFPVSREEAMTPYNGAPLRSPAQEASQTKQAQRQPGM